MTLHLRPATMDDAKMLFGWRNDPVTREASHNSDEVQWESHMEWLKKSLVSNTRILYIAEADGTPVGTMRADKENGEQEMSWTVAPEARGKGVGKQMVLQFVQEVLPGAKIVACIKHGNVASEKIAQALGLSPVKKKFSENTSPNPPILWR